MKPTPQKLRSLGFIKNKKGAWTNKGWNYTYDPISFPAKSTEELLLRIIDNLKDLAYWEMPPDKQAEE